MYSLHGQLPIPAFSLITGYINHSPSPIKVQKCVFASPPHPVSSPNVPPAGEGEDDWREVPVNGSLQAFLLRGLKAGPSYRVRLVARGGDPHQPAHLSEELVVTVPGEGVGAGRSRVCAGPVGQSMVEATGVLYQPACDACMTKRLD